MEWNIFHDWMKVEEISQFLTIFHKITNMIHDFEYLTSNLFLSELYKIKEILNAKSLDHSDYTKVITENLYSREMGNDHRTCSSILCSSSP